MSYLSFDAMDEEWRTVPTDLAGWANRASKLKTIAELLVEDLCESSESGYRIALKYFPEDKS